MKVKFSPLVSSMSGTAADAVMASWKGIQYVRKHVIPHNPQSAAQTLVRNALARCVTLWRSLNAPSKAWLDTYGVDYRLSGFNVFVQKCRALEQALSLIPVMPPNPHCPAVNTLAFVTGIGAGGDIDVSWVNNAPVGYTHVYLAARLSSSAEFEVVTSQAVAALAHTISGLTAGADYDCYGWFVDSTNVIMGTSDGDLAVTSKA